jgi:Protein of unknown function (DUF2849)
MPSVITANRLQDGVVVYLAAGIVWKTDLAEALVAHSETELARLEADAGKAAAGQIIVGAYAMDVELRDGKPAPKSVREKIRAAHRQTFPDLTEIGLH